MLFRSAIFSRIPAVSIAPMTVVISIAVPVSISRIVMSAIIPVIISMVDDRDPGDGCLDLVNQIDLFL